MRADRRILMPWLKFLWESYRNVLETLRVNARLERVYQVSTPLPLSLFSLLSLSLSRSIIIMIITRKLLVRPLISVPHTLDASSSSVCVSSCVRISATFSVLPRILRLRIVSLSTQLRPSSTTWKLVSASSLWPHNSNCGRKPGRPSRTLLP